jgi:hypothetical protein
MKDCIYCNMSETSDHEVILSNDFCIYSLLNEQEIKGAGIIVPRSHKETVGLELWACRRTTYISFTSPRHTSILG